MIEEVLLALHMYSSRKPEYFSSFTLNLKDTDNNYYNARPITNYIIFEWVGSYPFFCLTNADCCGGYYFGRWLLIASSYQTKAWLPLS
jgi:hypothetical protein